MSASPSAFIVSPAFRPLAVTAASTTNPPAPASCLFLPRTRRATAPLFRQPSLPPPRRRRLRSASESLDPSSALCDKENNSEDQQQQQPPEPEAGEGRSPLDPDDSVRSDIALPSLRDLFTGAGDPNCEQCEGKGLIDCPVCDGTGVFSVTMMGVTSATTCRMCKGQRRIPCPSCRAEVFKAVLWWDQVPRDEDGNEVDDDDLPEGKFRWGSSPVEP